MNFSSQVKHMPFSRLSRISAGDIWWTDACLKGGEGLVLGLGSKGGRLADFRVWEEDGPIGVACVWGLVWYLKVGWVLGPYFSS